MNRTLSVILAVALFMTMLFSCSSTDNTRYNISSGITVVSSSAKEYGEWLTDRLENIPDNVVIGIGNNSEYAVELSDFEDDGYIIRSIGNSTAIFGKSAEGLDLACRRYANDIDLYGKAQEIVYHEGYRIDSLNLFDSPIDSYTIEYSSEANDNMRLAVSEFQRLLKMACGAELSAVEGNSEAERVISFKFSDGSDLGDNGFRYFEKDGSLIIEGAKARGCLNAVYTFFEDECGWDGLYLGDSCLRDSSQIIIPKGISKICVPAFDYLDTNTSVLSSFGTNKATPSDSEMSFGPITHADAGISESEFRDLTDLDTDNAICFSSEDTFKTVHTLVKNYVYNKSQTGLTVGESLKEIDFSALCGGEYCVCEDCSDTLKKEGSTAGSAVIFFNRLSKKLSDSFPGLVYKLLIDGSTVTPPKTAPNEYLHVTFSYSGSCANHTLSGKDCTSTVSNSGMNNADFAENIEGWLNLTDNVYVVLNKTESPLQQFTVLDTIYDDMKYLYSIGVRGIYWDTQYSGLGIQRIEYMLVDLLNRNINMTSAEFEDRMCRLLQKEYGDGWEYILNYINIWIDSENLAECWNCSDPALAGYSDRRYDTDFYAENFSTAIELFNKATSLVCNKKQLKMCDLLSCHMYYEGCFSSYFPIYYAEDADAIAFLDDRYSHIVKTLEVYGYDIENLPINDNEYVSFSSDLYDAAWRDWFPWKDDLYSGDEGIVLPDSYLDFADTASKNTDDDRLTFAFKTDSHFSAGNSVNGLLQFANIQKYVPLDFYVHGGDLINGDHETEEIAVRSLTTAIDSMSPVHSVPFISLRGNHDDNSWPYVLSTNSKYGVFPEDGILDTRQWRELAFTKSTKIVMDDNGCYGYMDHEESKIRVLFVDTSDLPYEADADGYYNYGAFAGHGIRNDQLNFMAEAMTFADKGDDGKNWAILIMSHVPIETMRSPTSPYRFGIPDALPRNNYAFLRIVKAYQRGEVFNETQKNPTNYGDGGIVQGAYNDPTGDFAYSVYADFSKNGPGEVIGFVCGHTHTDNLATNVGKVSYSGANNKIYPKLSDGYAYISVGPIGFAVITVDRDSNGNGTIYVDKYGTSIVPRKDMISDGDNASVSTDPVIADITSTEPDTGSVASGHYSVNYSQNP